MKKTYKEKMVAPWYSSYVENNYGELFYALTRVYQPKIVVELGTKAAYSSYYIAKAMKENGRGVVHCYDLWEKYQYNSVPMSVAAKNLKKYSKFVKLHLADVAVAIKKHDMIDILHVDLGNHGESMEELIPQWLPKVRQFIIIEGGSASRDEVAWVKKYNKKPLEPWLRALEKKHANLEVFTIDRFPSVTLIRKRA